MPFVSHKIDPIACPNCNACLDGATNVEGEAKPNEGAFTVCAYCGKILIFTDGARALKIAQREDLKELPSDVLLTLLHISGAAKFLRHRRN